MECHVDAHLRKRTSSGALRCSSLTAPARENSKMRMATKYKSPVSNTDKKAESYDDLSDLLRIGDPSKCRLSY